MTQFFAEPIQWIAGVSVVSVVGLVIACVRLARTKEAQVVANTLALCDKFQSPEIVATRHKLKSMRPTRDAPEIDFGIIPENEQSEFRSFVLLLCLASQLIDRGYVDKEIFFSLMSEPIDRSGFRIESYLDQRVKTGKDRRLQVYFQRLQKEAKNYL